jgi:hypothetical protein
MIAGGAAGAGTDHAWLQAGVNRAIQRLGKSRVGIYSSRYGWQVAMGSYSDFSSLPIWYAHYDFNPSFGDWVNFAGWSVKLVAQALWLASQQTRRGNSFATSLLCGSLCANADCTGLGQRSSNIKATPQCATFRSISTTTTEHKFEFNQPRCIPHQSKRQPCASSLASAM